MPLQIRRGNTAEVNSITPLVGELVYDTQLKRVVIGDGSTAGGNPFGGVSVNEAKDAAAASLLGGTHQNINFSYDSVNRTLSASVDVTISDTIETDAIITGKIFNSSSTVVLDVDTGNLTGNVVGNVTGDTTGYHTGDVKGSVFSDGSTLLVDAVAGVIPAAVVQGTFTGSVVGNVTGNVTGDTNGTHTGPVIGNVTGNTTGYHTGDVKGSIFADDSSLIVNAIDGTLFGTFRGDVFTSSISTATTFIDFNSGTRFNQPVSVLSPSTFKSEAVFSTEATGNRIVSIDQHHDDALTSSSMAFRRSRGTSSSPTAIQNGDIVGNLSFTGRSGSTYLSSAVIRAVVDDTVTSTAVPGRLEFLTADASGTLVETMSIESTGIARFINQISLQTSTYLGGLALAVFEQSHTSADARNFVFSRSRGTVTSPISVNNGDDIIDISFNGHDGSNYFVSAALSVTVDSAPSAGNVRSGFNFATYNGSSFGTRVNINSSGLLTANSNIATPSVSPIATDGDLVLDPASKGTGTVDIKAPEQSTVGSAGAASALPATPSTYLKVKINGVEYVIPAYAVS